MSKNRRDFIGPVILMAALVVNMAGCAGSQTHDRSSEEAADIERAEKQILLTVEQPASTLIAPVGTPGKAYLRRYRYRGTPATERTLNEIADEYELLRVDGWHIGSLGVYCEILEVPEGISADEVVARLSGDVRVDSAQPMNLFQTQAPRATAREYDDPYLDLQSAIDSMQVTKAHSLATGKGVTIAIVDTGVDQSHPDLADRISISRSFVSVTGKPSEQDVHGTAIAGIIASVPDNSVGIVGVAPEVKLLVLRACWYTGSPTDGARCSSLTLARALDYAISQEPDILNLSLAGASDPLLSRLIEKAIAQGIIVVAAGGDHSDDSTFPASMPEVIPVRSDRWHLERVNADSQAGDQIIAPGDNILTTAPNGEYAYYSGSSLAAAHVSGIVALLMERNPQLTPSEAYSLLLSAGRDSSGPRVVSACRALAQLLDANCSEVVADL